MKQRYICCAYISTNSKIYNIDSTPSQATPWLNWIPCFAQIQFNHLNLHFCYARVKDTTGTSPIKQTRPPPSPCACVGSCKCCGHGSSSSSSYSTSSPSLSCLTPSSVCGCPLSPHPSHPPLPHTPHAPVACCPHYHIWVCVWVWEAGGTCVLDLCSVQGMCLL